MKRKCIICKRTHENESLLCDNCTCFALCITFIKKGKRTIYQLNKRGKELLEKRRKNI